MRAHPARNLAHARRELVGTPHNDVLTAMLTDDGRLPFAADDADDDGAQVERPLQGDEPDAAGRRVDHDHLSAPDPPHSSQQAFRRHPLEHRRGGEAVAHPQGNAHQPLCGHHSLLHVGAGLRVRIGDAIARG